MLAKTGYVSCPFNLLRRYVSAANLDLSSSLPFFRSLYFHKATSTYSLRIGMSYSRTRGIVLQAFVELGYPKNLFGLQGREVLPRPLTKALVIGLFKRHGRWKTDQAKDGYIKDKLDSLLSVYKSLHI